MTKRRALLSVSDKTGLTEFAKGLVARGFELVSTGGTARALEEAGLKVTPVSDVTGLPEMTDGRVKPLHPMIHGGILARRHVQVDRVAAITHAITMIDLLAVNLYPFQNKAADPNATFDQLIEEIDIGGPSLVRAAAKNFRDVLVVVHPYDYEAVLLALDHPEDSKRFRFEMAKQALYHTAQYDAFIVGHLDSSVDFDDNDNPYVIPSSGALPRHFSRIYVLDRSLRYGENPHQAGGYYREFGSPSSVYLVQGKELSYNNIRDAAAARRTALAFEDRAAAIVKHLCACGVATSTEALRTAYVNAREADPLSAYGGIAGFNSKVDVETAEAIVQTFMECVIAPGFDSDALEVLASKPELRVLVDSAPYATTEFTPEMGGALLQEVDRVDEARLTWPNNDPLLRVVSKVQPTPEQWEELRFTWRVCAHVKSNSIVFGKRELLAGANPPRNFLTVGIGGGQPSRVASALIAGGALLDFRRNRGNYCVAASDAFFPKRDGLDAVIASGAQAVVQPGGSKYDQEMIAIADDNKIAMVFTGRRHFRH